MDIFHHIILQIIHHNSICNLWHDFPPSLSLVLVLTMDDSLASSHWKYFSLIMQVWWMILYLPWFAFASSGDMVNFGCQVLSHTPASLSEMFSVEMTKELLDICQDIQQMNVMILVIFTAAARRCNCSLLGPSTIFHWYSQGSSSIHFWNA